MSEIDIYLDRSLSALGRGADEVADMAIDAYDYASELPDIIADGAIDAYEYLKDKQGAVGQYIIEKPIDSAATAAEILPGAGVKDALEFSAKATQNIKDKNYLDAAINTATSGAMVATEAVPIVGAMVAKPAIKALNKAITKSAPAFIPKLLPQTSKKLVKFLDGPKAKKLVKEGATKSDLVKAFNTAKDGSSKKNLVTIDHITAQLNVSNPFAKLSFDADIPQPSPVKLVSSNEKPVPKTSAEKMYGDAEDAEYLKIQEDQLNDFDNFGEPDFDFIDEDSLAAEVAADESFKLSQIQSMNTSKGTGYPTKEQWAATIVRPSAGKEKFSNTEKLIINGEYDKAKNAFEAAPRKPAVGPKVFVGERELSDDFMVEGKFGKYPEVEETQAIYEKRAIDNSNITRSKTSDGSLGDPVQMYHQELRTPMYSASTDPLVALWSFASKGFGNARSATSIKKALKDSMYVLETYDGRVLRYDDLSDMSPDKYLAIQKSSTRKNQPSLDGKPGKVTTLLNNNDQKKLVDLFVTKYKSQIESGVPGTPEIVAASKEYVNKTVETLRTMNGKVSQADYDEADKIASRMLRTEVQYNPQKLPQHGIAHDESEIAFPDPSKTKWRKLTEDEQSNLYDGMMQSQENFNAIRGLANTLKYSGPEQAYNVFRQAMKSQLGLVRVAKTPELRGVTQRIFTTGLADANSTANVLTNIRNQLNDKATDILIKTNMEREAKGLATIDYKAPQKVEQIDKYILGMKAANHGSNTRRMFQGNNRPDQMSFTEKTVFENVKKQMESSGLSPSNKEVIKSIQKSEPIKSPKFEGLHKVIDGMDKGGLVARKKYK